MMNYVILFILAVASYASYPMFFGIKKGILKDFVYTSDVDNSTELVIKPKPAVAPKAPDASSANNTNTTPTPDKPTAPPKANVDIKGSITQADFPALCEMISSGTAILDGGNGNISLNQGDKLKPIAISGNSLTVEIAKLNGAQGAIVVSKTNFFDLTLPKTQARLDGKLTTPEAKVKPEIKPVQNTTKEDPVSMGGGDTPAEIEGDPFEMADGGDSGSEPEPVLISDADAKALMKSSFGSLSTLNGAVIRTISMSEPELLEGKDYQVGEVLFEKETLLGKRQLNAKAYISGNKVEKWLWAKSKQEIK
ncbi:hypothetical protein OAB00_03540 [Akkermansiaceae bacterium]|nr:hypothetical protein [Akkermansiaceae bacterium]